MRMPRPAPGGTLDAWRGRPPAGHAWSAVLVVLVPFVACVLPLALHGFPAHGACYADDPSGGLVDAIRRDGRICAAVAGAGLLIAGLMWWDTFDDPPEAAATVWSSSSRRSGSSCSTACSSS